MHAKHARSDSDTGEPGPDWNTDLDLHAWVALWRSGLPIHWYPCSGRQGLRGIEQLQPMELVSAACKVSDTALDSWTPGPESETTRIFCRDLDEDHVRAMGEAANALLKQFPLS